MLITFGEFFSPTYTSQQQLKEIYLLSQAMSDVAVPQEYGVTQEEKLSIASKISRPLLEKLLHDLRIGI